MGIIKFKIHDKIVTLDEDDELIHLLKNDDEFTIQFIETAMKKGKLNKFGLFYNEIDNLEIIRLDNSEAFIEESPYSGDTEMSSVSEATSIIVNPLQESNKETTWITICTKLLLSLYIENVKKVGKSSNLKNKKSLWKLISEEMAKQGYDFSSRQVENRYKTLDRGYKEKTVNNKKTGRNRASCEYQEQLDEIYQENRAVYPEYLLESSGSGKTTEEIRSSVASEESSSVEEKEKKERSERKNKSHTILEEIKQLRQIRVDELEFKKQRETERIRYRETLLELEREKLEAYKERNNLLKDQL